MHTTTRPGRLWRAMLPLFGVAVLLQGGPVLASGAAPTPALKAVRASKEAALAEGTVVSIDVGQARITLKHGAIQALGMPAMTMVFQAAESAMLARVKPGDAVKFKVVRTENHFTVTQLSPR